jgi:hypothetical protein
MIVSPTLSRQGRRRQPLEVVPPAYVLGVDHDGGKPSVGLAADCHALEYAREPDGLAHLNPANDRELDALCIAAEGAYLIGSTEAVVNALFQSLARSSKCNPSPSMPRLQRIATFSPCLTERLATLHSVMNLFI